MSGFLDLPWWAEAIIVLAAASLFTIFMIGCVVIYAVLFSSDDIEHN